METCVRLPGETRPVPGHFVDVKIARRIATSYDQENV